MKGIKAMKATERMAELLKQQNKTEQELAEHLGISKNSVRMWKYKQELPPQKYIDKVAAFLGVSISFLTTGVPDVESDTLSEDIEELLTLYAKMSELRKSEVLSYMRTLVEEDGPDEIIERLKDLTAVKE